MNGKIINFRPGPFKRKATTSGTLELIGDRHVLDGREVHCGDQLRLRVSENPEVWAWARYEADFTEDGARVTLHTTFGVVLRRNGETFLRWPMEGER